MSMHFYQQQAESVRSQVPWVLALQQQGLKDLQQLGFPTKRDEDWRYTSVDGFLKQPFDRMTQTDEQSLTSLAVGHQVDVPWGHKLAFVDGVILGLEALQGALPPGVMVTSLQTAMHSHADKIRPYLGQILQSKHGFHAQNTAMLELGLFIYVPAYVQVTEPILLVHWQTHTGQASYLRHVVVAETGATVTLIEDYQGDANACYYTNTISELYAGSQASIRHYKVQRESKLAYHVGHVAVQQTEGSDVKSHVLSLGADWSRSDVRFDLQAPYASCQLNGIYALCEQQHMDHHTWVYHNAPACTSEEDYKGILTGKSRAVFNGQVHVASLAQKTVAKQQNKNLLLSKYAEIDTKPQLDIAADDVLCTHGATVGQLDNEALFYFATRGIEESEATHYLIQAFAADNLRAMHHDPLATWVGGLLNQHLGSHYD